MKKLLLLLALSITVAGLTQEAKQPAKWKYAGMVQGGMIAGSSGPDYTVQTIHGMARGAWMIGAGAGIDHYGIPGFPLLAYGQYNHGKGNSKPCAYVQAGPVVPWATDEWDDKVAGMDMYKLHGGWLAEGGLGLEMPFSKKIGMLASLGYSIKQSNYDEMQIFWIWPWPISTPPEGFEPNYYQNKLTMNRLVIKIGVRF